MAKNTTIKGGTVTRNAKTGRVVEVTTRKGVSKASPKSRETAKTASSKRSSALTRLANR